MRGELTAQRERTKMSNTILIDSMNKCLFNFWGESNCITPATIILIVGVTGILFLVVGFLIPKISKKGAGEGK